MSPAVSFPQEYRIPVLQDYVRTIKDPHLDLTTIHALVKVRDLPSGNIPDKINPRSHETIRMGSRIPHAITESLTERPELFHLLNRGCLILAKKAWYDNQTKTLHIVLESEDEHGMVDGATTDRVLANLKRQVSNVDFNSLREDEIPEHFKEAYIHLEVVAGDLEQEIRINLADARNTSEQVKEFSLQDLGGNFDWLKELLEKSEFRGKVRYRENEPKPVDIRTVLALLTLFHPRWLKLGKDPIVAYTGKGAVLEMYKDPAWRDGYERLERVALDIIKLYDYVHAEFQTAYRTAYGDGSKLGKRKEVRYIDKPGRAKELALTGKTTQYVLPDGWLYPILGSLRMLLEWPRSGPAEWRFDPFDFFSQYGPKLVSSLVERSEELGRNPNATGKSRGVWNELRIMVDNHLLRDKHRVGVPA